MKFNVSEKIIPAEFIGHILSRGTKFLSLLETNLEGQGSRLFPKQNKLKYLNLFNCSSSNERILQELIFSCHSLEKLSIGGRQISKYIKTLIQQNRLTLKVLDISAAKFITHHVIQQIVSSCLKLEEINLSGTRIPQETVTFLCQNLPENLLKISLGYLKVTDENVQDLVNRCCKMMEIDLHGTDITNEAVTAMIQGV